MKPYFSQTRAAVRAVVRMAVQVPLQAALHCEHELEAGIRAAAKECSPRHALITGRRLRRK